ncbi:MAG: ABC transporter ATP-binding protein/permease, partial [Chloroflexaceae bacterium]|nr:ABC transporter ATP-binding protein/permease [Chloroflexaceae bacterium]
MTTWHYAWALVRYSRRNFLLGYGLWVAFIVIPLLGGLVLQALFDTLSGQATIGIPIWGLLALFLASDMVRLVVFRVCFFFWMTFWYLALALLRHNMLAWLVQGPGPRRLPDTPGEAVSRFRDDPLELLEFVDTWLDVSGELLFSIVALIIMFSINPWITAVVFVPTIAIFTVTRLLSDRIVTYRTRSREATGRVTGFIGEMFSAVLALKVAGAEGRAVQRLRTLSVTRQQAALKDSLFTEMLDSLNANVSNLTLGLILLMAAGAMSSGGFTVGNFVLFASYISGLVAVPRWVGRMMARYKQAGVSVARMQALVDPAAPETLVAHGPVFGETPEKRRDAEMQRRRDTEQLAVPSGGSKETANCKLGTANISPVLGSRVSVLTIDNLSYRFPDTGRGITNISLRLERGSFTVITGRIGAGKTTLLRVLLGLLPRDGGSIHWNGMAVADPASFFVPPRSAYTPQVPRLFSDSLRDNVLLGFNAETQPDVNAETQRREETETKPTTSAPLHLSASALETAALERALHLAVMERDVTTLERGLDTVVGPRGVRLSGGQMQRTAAARMFVRQPELLVFDDLSSALDVETERTLWERLQIADCRLQIADDTNHASAQFSTLNSQFA